LIYEVIKNENKGLGCRKTIKHDESIKVKPKPLYVYFVPAGTKLDVSA
jgi:hypothetical protein